MARHAAPGGALLALLGAAMLAPPAGAQTHQPTPLVKALAGHYENRFPNSDTGGNHYTSVDTFELVPYRDDAAYFDLHLEFFNGHECNISGIAKAEADGLTYRAPKEEKGPSCVFTITRQAGGIRFEDVNGTCRDATCGARGGYANSGAATFSLSRRRPVSNVARVKASDDFKDAVKAFEALGH